MAARKHVSQPRMTSDAPEQAPLSSNRDNFPCCLVWAPIPLITWLFPVIGHMGICTSQGVILDFAGPYYVASGHSTIFGKPTRWMRPVASHRKSHHHSALASVDAAQVSATRA